MTKSDDTLTLIVFIGFGVFLFLYLTGRLAKPLQWLSDLNKYLGVKN